MRAGSPRLLREINDRAALEVMLRSGPLTRADLEAAIGLSKPATAQLLTRLEGGGSVVRSGLRGGSRGPRAQLWRVNGALARVAAVDLTTDAADIVIADLAGDILAQRRVPMPAATPGPGPDPTSPAEREPDHPTTPTDTDVVGAFVAALESTLAGADLRPTDLRRVVVGAQGAIDPHTGHLRYAPHLPAWAGFDVSGRLTAALGVEVVVDNDVNLVAVAEMTAGRASAVTDFVLVWLGTGVGSAVVVNRALLHGAHGGAGEIDAMLVPDRAERGTGVDRRGVRFGDLLGATEVLRLALAHNISAPSAAVAVTRAPSVGKAGRDFLSDLARRIATGVAGAASLLDPDLVLLAGDTGQAGGQHLCQLVQEELGRLGLPRTPVAPATVTGNPVRTGALHRALTAAREQVFGLTDTAVPSVRR
ncbi:sugar kinase [Longimycelium tulufanense]|uniref:Sugar kinase n=1 Tax=Longimycelium tulufanense TaxID=907463 RepID=A0A8J3CBQ9_9PSEU|nr:ROK family transcriptional regulator [Longimycelium tulufanense]GGM44088.1 sugar kinase [Longimycelium tulufanense]